MDIKETPQALALRMRQLNHVRDLHQVISGHRSLARAAFNSLKPGQQNMLLKAAGIIRPIAIIEQQDVITGAINQFQHVFPANWDLFTDKEIEMLFIGIQRLSAIVNTFAHCDNNDFKKETNQKVA